MSKVIKPKYTIVTFDCPECNHPRSIQSSSETYDGFGHVKTRTIKCILCGEIFEALNPFYKNAG